MAGIPGSYLSEMLQHSVWAHEKLQTFVGREQLVDKVLWHVYPTYTDTVSQGESLNDTRGSEPGLGPGGLIRSLYRGLQLTWSKRVHPEQPDPSSVPEGITREGRTVRSSDKHKASKFAGVSLAVIGVSGELQSPVFIDTLFICRCLMPLPHVTVPSCAALDFVSSQCSCAVLSFLISLLLYCTFYRRRQDCTYG